LRDALHHVKSLRLGKGLSGTTTNALRAVIS
jgi:hypothetical protein